MRFIVLTLPRSRSAWLAEYLGPPGIACGHDVAIGCGSIAEFERALSTLDGTVETGAVFGWRLLLARYPEARVVTISRPVDEIHASLERLGVRLAPGWLEKRAKLLRAASRDPRVISLGYRDLDSPAICRSLFELCTGLPWDEARYRELAATNIQIDFMARLEQLRDRAAELERFKAEVADAAI